MKYARRVDDNQGEIVEALEGIGVRVHITSGLGEFVDLICFWRGQVKLLEIKDGAKAPSRRKLTPAQVRLHSKALEAGVRIPVIETVEQALAEFGARRAA